MANTKTHPGAFRCYEAAMPDEPMFVILGRDPAGPATLEFWAQERVKQGKVTELDDKGRIRAALDEATEMAEWRNNNLDPLGDGVATWKLPRQIMDDDRPVRMAPELGMGYKLPDSDIATDPTFRQKIAIGLRQVASDMLAEAAMLTEDPSTMFERFSDRVNGYAAEMEASKVDPYETFAAHMRNQIAEDEAAPIHLVRGNRHFAFSKEEAALTCLLEDDLDVSLTDLIETYRNSHKKPVADSAPDDLAHQPEVPPHRFSMFHKGNRYAYARGLEINPSHLPTALDALHEDGWELLSIFGQTDSRHVGFIFKRAEPPAIPSMEVLINGMDSEKTHHTDAQWGGLTRRIGEPISYLKMKMGSWHPDDFSAFLASEKVTSRDQYWSTASVASVLRLIRAMNLQDQVWLLSKMSPSALDKALSSPAAVIRSLHQGRPRVMDDKVMDAYKEGRPLEEIAEIISDSPLAVDIHISGSDLTNRLALAKQLERLLVGYPSHETFRVQIGSDHQPRIAPSSKYAYVLFTHEGNPATGGHKLTSQRTMWPCKPAEQGCAEWVDGEGQRP